MPDSGGGSTLRCLAEFSDTCGGVITQRLLQAGLERPRLTCHSGASAGGTARVLLHCLVGMPAR